MQDHARNVGNLNRRIAALYAGPQTYPLPPPQSPSTYRNGTAARLSFWEYNNPWLRHDESHQLSSPTRLTPKRGHARTTRVSSHTKGPVRTGVPARRLDWERVLAAATFDASPSDVQTPREARSAQLVLHFQWVMLEEIVQQHVFSEEALRDMFRQVLASQPAEVREELGLAVQALKKHLGVVG